MIIADSTIQAVDMDMAKRFAWFRNEFVSPKQIEASKMINCSQGKLSEIEAGKRKIDFKTLRTLSTKFRLNTEWLATGDGDPLTKETPEDTAANITINQLQKSMRETKASVLDLERTILIMQKNQEFFLTRIQAFVKEQEVKITSLQDEVIKLKT